MTKLQELTGGRENTPLGTRLLQYLSAPYMIQFHNTYIPHCSDPHSHRSTHSAQPYHISSWLHDVKNQSCNSIQRALLSCQDVVLRAPQTIVAPLSCHVMSALTRPMQAGQAHMTSCIASPRECSLVWTAYARRGAFFARQACTWLPRNEASSS